MPSEELESRVAALLSASGYTEFNVRLPDRVLQENHLKRKKRNEHKKEARALSI